MYDGSINIDTRIDTKGVNKGTKSISASLGGVLRSAMAVAKTLATVFVGGAIINGIKSLIGQFDLMGSSIGASVKNLSTAFGALKGAFVNLLITALAPLIPYVITFVQWLTQLFNIVTAIIGALFGVQAGFSGVASSAGGAGSAIKKAGKDAKGSLAAFDQINVLAQNKQEDAPNAGGAGGGLPLMPTSPISQELIDKVNAFKASLLEFLQPVTDALGRLYDALVPLGETIWAGLQWAWEHILVPLGEWTVTDLVPAFLDLLASAANVLNEALIALAPHAEKFFDDFLAPLGEWAGGKIIAFLDWLAVKLDELATWIKENPAKFEKFVKVMGTLAAIVLTVAAAYQIATFITALFSAASLVLSGSLWAAAAAALAAAWPIIALTLLIAGIIVVIYLLITRWEALSTTVKQISFIIGFYVGQMADKIKTGFFSALDAIKAKFETIFTGIQNFIKGSINNIIGFINTMIQSVVNGINGVIRGLNTVGSLVPGFSAVATVAAPQIPRLATGAVIPPNAEFLAVLGDQKSGKNIEAPEGLIRRIFREESGGNQNQTITINFTGSASEIVRLLKPEIDRENVRIGGSLIKGGV